MTTHCPIVLKTALNHIMILHDKNHAYFVAFKKNKKLDKSAVKKDSAPLVMTIKVNNHKDKDNMVCKTNSV